VDEYLKGASNHYVTTTYVHNGNIFKCFDSMTYFDTFLPEEGKNFNLLGFKSRSELATLSTSEQEFYCTDEPTGYRAEPKPIKKDKKNERQDR
jgi:hypothetical protein